MKQNVLMPLNKKIKPMKYCVFDIESEEWIKPFAVGFYDGEQEPIIFEGFDCVKKFLDYFLSHRYRNWVCFAHNGGKYDFNFIVDCLKNNFKEFHLKLIISNSRILRIKIYNYDYSKKWIFSDSFSLLPKSLDSIGKSFNTVHQKLKIDYENIRKSDNWREYLKNDCYVLYEALTKFKEYFDKENIGLRWTIAQQSLATFRASLKFPLLRLDKAYENFVRKTYYGGRVEVFKMYGENLNYYDINSLYPYCMKNYIPIGRPNKIIGNKNLLDSVGFAKAKVYSPLEQYIPILPYRLKDKLIFPVGWFEGYWTLEELRKAKEFGYKIKLIKTLVFSKEMLFKDFVEYFYDIKLKAEKEGNQVLYWISKLILNSLYGKFGQRRSMDEIVITPSNEDIINKKLKPLNLDLDVWKKNSYNVSAHIIPSISAYITSYSRLKLFDLIQDVKNKVWYCDTDSIITSENLNTSSELGGLKLQHRILRGYFIAPKFYGIMTNPEGFISVLKGFENENKFNEDSYKKALFGDFSDFKFEDLSFASLKESMRRNKVFVSMVSKKKSIKSEYSKRNLFDMEQFDTSPIILNKRKGFKGET